MNQLAEIKVSYKTANTRKYKITTTSEAYDLALNSWEEETLELFEEFKVIYLNRANHVLGIYPLSKGSVSGTVVDVRLIFAIALKCNASGLILLHNHPSGNLTPSSADISITKKVKECSLLLEVNLIDHIIITRNGFYSFTAEEMF